MTIDETHGKIPGHFTVLNLNVKLPALVDNLEGEVLTCEKPERTEF
jgi:hypothetical protein